MTYLKILTIILIASMTKGLSPGTAMITKVKNTLLPFLLLVLRIKSELLESFGLQKL